MSGPWTAVALLPWRGWRHRGVAWRRMLGLLLVLAVPLLVLLRYQLAPGVAVSAFGLTLLTWAWWRQAGGLLRQNRPALARLLPAQARVLRHSLLLQGAAVTAAAAALAMGGLGAGATALGWTVIAVLAAAWLQREPWLWLPLSVAPLLPVPWRAGMVAAAAWPAPVQLALLAAAALLLQAALGRGGPWHRRDHARRQRWTADDRAEADGRPRPLALRAPWVRALAWPFVWPLTLRRRALLRRAGPGNVLARLELGLRTGGTWPMLAWILGLVLLLVGTGLTAAVQLGGVRLLHVVDGAHVGLCLGLFSALQSQVMDRAAALWGRRPEQALLVLLPGPPPGAALAAALQARWRHGQLAAWALGTVLVLAITSFGSPGSQQFAAGFAAGYLPLIWWTQHRHHRLRAAPGPLEAWVASPLLAALPGGLAEAAGVPVLASLAAGLAVAALCAAATRAPVRPLLPLGRAG